MSGISKACCSIPPVVSKGYQPKGEYKTINGLKTYVTGPESATKAILVVYDIFGFFDQTIQGADILATSTDQKYRVFIPDFFEGSPADISWYPPTTQEHKEKLGNFFSTKAVPPKTLSKIPSIVAEGNKLAPGDPAVSARKIASSAAQWHHDAMNIPMVLLASKDEPAQDIKDFEANLKGPKYVETFPTQIHGWMAARSDLESPEVRKEYERGYKTVLEFFHQHS
ncbi:hypothetical protein PDIDSM_4536 [Penicillium digitatum]|nr:hypothetical protein PDIDSM_4536 [Penicillium digitatum]